MVHETLGVRAPGLVTCTDTDAQGLMDQLKERFTASRLTVGWRRHTGVSAPDGPTRLRKADIQRRDSAGVVARRPTSNAAVARVWFPPGPHPRPRWHGRGCVQAPHPNAAVARAWSRAGPHLNAAVARAWLRAGPRPQRRGGTDVVARRPTSDGAGVVARRPTSRCRRRTAGQRAELGFEWKTVLEGGPSCPRAVGVFRPAAPSD
jgi:hypothetical protein